MVDEHSNHQENEAQPSDSSLQRRTIHQSGTDSRPDGKRREGLATNRTGTPRGNGISEQGEILDAEILDQVSDRVASELMSVTRIAPLPEPGELQAYNDIERGLANRIVMMAEQSAEAANAATKSNAAVNNALAQSILEEGRSIKRGQWMFFALTILFLLTAVGLELLNRTPFATGMGILGFLSLIGVIVRSKTGPRWKPASGGDED